MSIREFVSYCKKKRDSIFVLSLFVVVIFGAWLSQNITTFDEEGLFYAADAEPWFRQWLELGRWGFVALKRILRISVANPFFSIAIFLLAFIASIILWGFHFETIAKKSTSRWELLIFSLVYATHPIWALQFGYRNQIEVCAIVMMLMPVAVICFFRWLSERRLLDLILAFLLAVFCFGSYQSFVFLFYTAVLFSLYRMTEDERFCSKKRFWKRIIVSAVFFIVTFLVSQGITKLVLRRVFGTNQLESYLSDQIMWTRMPFGDCIKAILTTIKQSLFGNGLEFNLLLGIEFMILLLIVIQNFVLKKEYRWRILFLFPFLFFAPFMLEIATAGPIVSRSKFSLVFVVAGLAVICLKWIYQTIRPYCKGRVAGALALILLLCAVLPQFERMERFFYTQVAVSEYDEMEMYSIYQRALLKGAVEGDAIYFYGGRSNVDNDAMMNSEIEGYSYFEVTMVEPNKIVKAMRSHGMRVSLFTVEQEARAIELAQTMPCWPDPDGIYVEEGLIVVKLSDM